ncbi:hypothetical protein [Xanthomonas graminis]|uniref:hypothetical protein n=1 Tax=Xanthomonas graminis TaxID=3390026 RepID=UPI000AFBED56|nr:hypothetical protein [Xanthomonas translucens]
MSTEAGAIHINAANAITHSDFAFFPKIDDTMRHFLSWGEDSENRLRSFHGIVKPVTLNDAIPV